MITLHIFLQKEYNRDIMIQRQMSLSLAL